MSDSEEYDSDLEALNVHKSLLELTKGVRSIQINL